MTAPRLLRAAAAFLLLLLLLPVAAPAAAGQTAGQQALMAEAGVDFPEEIAGFRRIGIGSVGPGRVGGQYAGPGDAVVDIFIVRSDVPVDVELASTEALIARIFANLATVRDLAAPPGASGAVGRLWRGDSNVGPVLTGLMLFQRRGWRIKIRGTVAAAAGEAGWAGIERLMHDFDWGAPAT